MYVCMSVCMYVYTGTCAHVCSRFCRCMVHACIYTYTHRCIIYIYIYLFESVSICHLSCQLNHISNVLHTVGASVLHSAEVKNLNRIQGVVLGTIATCLRCRQGPFSRKLMILLFIAVFLETHVSNSSQFAHSSSAFSDILLQPFFAFVP